MKCKKKIEKYSCGVHFLLAACITLMIVPSLYLRLPFSRIQRYCCSFPREFVCLFFPSVEFPSFERVFLFFWYLKTWTKRKQTVPRE